MGATVRCAIGAAPPSCDSIRKMALEALLPSTASRTVDVTAMKYFIALSALATLALGGLEDATHAVRPSLLPLVFLRFPFVRMTMFPFFLLGGVGGLASYPPSRCRS